jgi:hypothetical protein
VELPSYAGAPIPSPRTPAPGLPDLRQVSPEFFSTRIQTVRQKPPYSCYLTPFSTAEYRSMRCFLAHGDVIGGAIVDRGAGRHEIVSIYNNGCRPGGGWDMVDALVAMGGNYVECYRGYLSDNYAKHGFVEIGSEPWDSALAHEDWDVRRGGTPDVVHMALKTQRP